MSIPGSASPLLLASTAAAAGGYQVSRSLRFNAPDSAFLSRTPAVAGNRRTWTWAGWVKRSALGVSQALFEANPTGGDIYTLCWFDSSDKLQIVEDQGAGGVYYPITDAVYRDTSAWYHIVFTMNTTLATSTDRIKIYVNGVLQTLTGGFPPLNNDTYINATNAHRIGYRVGNSSALSAYLADIHFIDGQQLTPSSFTEVSATTGQLIPKTYTGTYGTNGFQLKFADNSAATATTLGKDTSGNSNNWTPNNFSITGQSAIGYPQALTAGSGSVTDPTLAFDGNTGTFAYAGSSATITFTPPTPISFTSKLEFWTTNGVGPGYFDQRFSYNGASEVSCSGAEWTTVVNGSGTLTSLSIRNTLSSISRLSAVRVDNSILIYNNGAGNDSLVDTPTSTGTDTGVGNEVRGNYCTLNPLSSPSASAPLSDGNLTITGSAIQNTYGTIGMSTGKWYWEVTCTTAGAAMLGIGNDPNSTGDAGNYKYYVNGNKYSPSTNSAYGASYTNGDIIGITYDADAGVITCYKNNASQGVMFSGLSGTYFPFFRNAGSAVNLSFNFGQRAFAYTAPSGFKALCDTNLPAPVVAKPNTVMDVKLYTGTGSTQTISGLNFSPDLVWIKARSAATAHLLFDQIRGATYYLSSNATDAESNIPSTTLTAFTSDGFTLGSNSSANGSSVTLAAWAWDAGTSTVSNTAGSITSQVRANPTAGFSVATWTGTGSGSATIGHGLGVKPRFILVKKRNATGPWYAQHGSLGAGQIAYLSSDSAFGATSGWNNTEPTSTVFSLGSAINDANTYVAYCFAPVDGYSNGFSYTGNGSTDGVFQYLGFRPRLILLKCSSTTGNWTLLDTAREGYNVDNDPLYPNLSNAEGTTDLLDITSNGFKLRTTDASVNSSGATYIGFAWAENPFQYARAR